VAVEVTNNADQGRYELRIDGRLAGVADYLKEGDTVVFPHTEIDASMRGQGLGAQLVRAALDDMRPTGASIVPSCWYVAQFITENPEYADMVAK
jgi:predicted GNAT family acetyltransferase